MGRRVETETETREQVIRRHWRRWGYHWDIDAIGPVLCMSERHPLDPFVALKTDPTEVSIPILRYQFERGRSDGEPAYRVLCEGFVVEEGRFPRPAPVTQKDKAE